MEFYCSTQQRAYPGTNFNSCRLSSAIYMGLPFTELHWGFSLATVGKKIHLLLALFYSPLFFLSLLTTVIFIIYSIILCLSNENKLPQSKATVLLKAVFLELGKKRHPVK